MSHPLTDFNAALQRVNAARAALNAAWSARAIALREGTATPAHADAVRAAQDEDQAGQTDYAAACRAL